MFCTSLETMQNKIHFTITCLIQEKSSKNKDWRNFNGLSCAQARQFGKDMQKPEINLREAFPLPSSASAMIAASYSSSVLNTSSPTASTVCSGVSAVVMSTRCNDIIS